MSQPIKAIDHAIDYTWGSGGTPTWVTFTDFLADGLEPGIEDIISVEMGDGGEKQEGVKLQGELKATGGTMPVAGTRHWFRFNLYDGTAFVVGGTKGCRVLLGDSNVRPLGGGPKYTLIRFNNAGKLRGDLIEADQT